MTSRRSSWYLVRSTQARMADWILVAAFRSRIACTRKKTHRGTGARVRHNIFDGVVCDAVQVTITRQPSADATCAAMENATILQRQDNRTC